MGIGDIVEASQELSPGAVRDLDEALAARGLPTLSKVRSRFARNIHSILKRGSIRREEEYYSLRNAVEYLPDVERAAGRSW